MICVSKLLKDIFLAFQLLQGATKGSLFMVSQHSKVSKSFAIFKLAWMASSRQLKRYPLKFEDQGSVVYLDQIQTYEFDETDACSPLSEAFAHQSVQASLEQYGTQWLQPT